MPVILFFSSRQNFARPIRNFRSNPSSTGAVRQHWYRTRMIYKPTHIKNMSLIFVLKQINFILKPDVSFLGQYISSASDWIKICFLPRFTSPDFIILKYLRLKESVICSVAHLYHKCQLFPINSVLWPKYCDEEKWAAAWQNKHNDMCAQRRFRSPWPSTQSGQSLRCRHEETLDP